MPGERFGIRYGVGQDAMCEVVPMAVQEMMRTFVRVCSPNWPTVRLEIREGGVTHTWDMLLSGEGEARRGQR